MSAHSRVMSNETIPHIVQALRAAALLSPSDDPSRVQAALVCAAKEMIQVFIQLSHRSLVLLSLDSL